MSDRSHSGSSIAYKHPVVPYAFPSLCLQQHTRTTHYLISLLIGRSITTLSNYSASAYGICTGLTTARVCERPRWPLSCCSRRASFLGRVVEMYYR
eukprot:scaffold85900_cov36-Prasinocladus_malaysianus.AAC.2